MTQVTMIRCDACSGRKKILGLGNMIKDCGDCRGTGYIEIPDEGLKVTLADVMTSSKKRKTKDELATQSQ